MPCYQVQTCSVELNNADHDLLEKALKKQGYTVYRSAGSKAITFSKGGVSGSYRTNKISFSYSSSEEKPDVDAIKRSYSEQVILRKASEYADEGWEMEQDGDEYVFRKNPGYGAVYA